MSTLFDIFEKMVRKFNDKFIFNLEGFENQGSCHKTIGSVNTFLHVTIHKYCMGENEKFISNFPDIL